MRDPSYPLEDAGLQSEDESGFERGELTEHHEREDVEVELQQMALPIPWSSILWQDCSQVITDRLSLICSTEAHGGVGLVLLSSCKGVFVLHMCKNTEWSEKF
jgi:hypothetical protein